MAKKRFGNAPDFKDLEMRHLEADTVCAQCGQINPEGTLLCKSCGNNLREQRSLRLTGAQPSSEPVVEKEHSGWLKKILALLGILLVLWVFFNATRIENFLTNAQMPNDDRAEVFWNGPESAVYEELLSQLDADPINEADFQRALREPQQEDAGLEGRYMLVSELAGRIQEQLGQALVQQQGDRLFFVARLRDDIEVRGEGWPEGVEQVVARDSAGVSIADGRYVAFGFALRKNFGSYECFGNSYFDSESTYKATAYRVPVVEQFQFNP